MMDIEKLKLLRIDITSFRDCNYSKFTQPLEHQILSNTISFLYAKIKDKDDKYYGDEYIKKAVQ